jgi:hypothetical protein
MEKAARGRLFHTSNRFGDLQAAVLPKLTVLKLTGCREKVNPNFAVRDWVESINCCEERFTRPLPKKPKPAPTETAQVQGPAPPAEAI